MSLQPENERPVVCAANRRRDDGTILLGARHWDGHMRGMAKRLYGEERVDWGSFEQGFIDSHGNWLTREEAFVRAKGLGQIKKKTGNPDGDALFSEDLY